MTMTHTLEKQGLLSLAMQQGFASFASADCKAIGAELHETYTQADPFPHIVIPSFLTDDAVRRVATEFPPHETGRYSDPQSRLKTGYHLEKIGSPYIHSVINALNSAAFLEFLRALTGIKGLIPDPYQVGGGLHETRRGGHLSIHADFNMHPSLKLKRRLNLILFLNDDWDETYGGHLELWSKDMQQCCKRVLPELGKAIIFNTDQDSFHGHPDPLTCPESRTRRSLALYYYCVFASDKIAHVSRSTDFRVRPGSTDRLDHKTRMRELARDMCPPILYRRLVKTEE